MAVVLNIWDRQKCQQYGHKANNIISNSSGHINGDGLTLHYKEIDWICHNWHSLGVHEVSEGTLETMIKEIDKQLTKIRDKAK